MSQDTDRRKLIAALARAGYVYVRQTTHGELYRNPVTNTFHQVPQPGHMGDIRAIRNQKSELRRKGIAI